MTLGLIRSFFNDSASLPNEWAPALPDSQRRFLYVATRIVCVQSGHEDERDVLEAFATLALLLSLNDNGLTDIALAVSLVAAESMERDGAFSCDACFRRVVQHLIDCGCDVDANSTNRELVRIGADAHFLRVNDFLAFFRFERSELPRLKAALFGNDERLRCSQRTACDVEEGLMILLLKMTRPRTDEALPVSQVPCHSHRSPRSS